jgi:hypothetical protein
MHKTKNDYYNEAKVILMGKYPIRNLAEHLKEMDEFFKKNPTAKKKWKKFQAEKVSKKVY